MSPELLAIVIAVVTILAIGAARVLVDYLKNRVDNSAKRADPDFQRNLENSLLERINEEREQRRIELLGVRKQAEEERNRSKEELRDLKVENRAELVAAKLEFKGERDALTQKLMVLEVKFDTFRAESDTKYRTDTDALKLRVDTLEAIIKELQETVAGLKAENATLKREAGQTTGDA